MSTYAQLKTRVYNRVIDLPTAVQDEVPALLNQAMKKLQEDHNFKVMEAEAAFTTALQTRVLGAKPSDFKEYRDEPYLLYEDGSFRKMQVNPSRHSALTVFDDAYEGIPVLLVDTEPSNELGSQNFAVYPLPDGNSDYGDGEYRVKLPYWKYLTPLSADGDQNWFTVNAEEYLYFKVSSDAFGLDWDENRMTVFAQLAENERKAAIKKDKLLRMSFMNTLVPLWQGVNTPHVRF